MTRKEFDSLYLGKAVHCKTDELADEFLELASKFGYYITVHNYNRFKENTCYRLNDGVVEYCYLDWYRKQGYEIIEFKSVKSNNDDLVDAFGYVMMSLNIKPKEKIVKDIVLKIFGIEIDEEFMLDINNKTRFKFNQNMQGLQQYAKGAFWVPDNDLLKDLINGRYKIIKIKEPLLTDAEREFLSNFEFEELEKNNEGDVYLNIDQCNNQVIDTKYCKHKFNGLENYRMYTRKELGL